MKTETLYVADRPDIQIKAIEINGEITKIGWVRKPEGKVKDENWRPEFDPSFYLSVLKDINELLLNKKIHQPPVKIGWARRFWRFFFQ